MRLTILLFFVSIAFNCFGQQHLRPARDHSQYGGVLRAYYENVFARLSTGFSVEAYARYTVIPSFSVEYAFSVEESGNTRYIISNTFNESYWSSRRRNEVKLISRKHEIDSSLYKVIGELFQGVAGQIREPERKTQEGFTMELVVIDGTGYHFTTTRKTGETIEGETRSPGANSLLDRLVIICGFPENPSGLYVQCGALFT